MTIQMESETYSNVDRFTYTNPADKNKDSFIECIRMHLLTCFLSNDGEKEKCYIKLGLMNPPQIPISQWVKSVSALNKYMELLPSRYCPQCTKNNKEVVLYDEADLAESF